jgi:hypothetical protein
MSKESKIKEARKLKKSGLIGLVMGVAMIAPKIIELTTGYIFQPNLDPQYASWATIASYFSMGPFLIGSLLYNGARNDLKELQ